MCQRRIISIKGYSGNGAEKIKEITEEKGLEKLFFLKSRNSQLTAHSILKSFIFFTIWIFRRINYVVPCSLLKFYEGHFLSFTSQAVKMKLSSKYRMFR